MVNRKLKKKLVSLVNGKWGIGQCLVSLVNCKWGNLFLVSLVSQNSSFAVRFLKICNCPKSALSGQKVKTFA